MCEIIGKITEIVSNQYHFAVLNQKVIALQRFFDFGVSGQTHFRSFRWLKKGRGHEYKMHIL